MTLVYPAISVCSRIWVCRSPERGIGYPGADGWFVTPAACRKDQHADLRSRGSFYTWEISGPPHWEVCTNPAEKQQEIAF